MARTYQRHGLVIESIKRGATSGVGNPSYWLTFTDGSKARTQTNGSVAYGLPNPEYRDVPLTVTFTPSGRIVNVEVERD